LPVRDVDFQQASGSYGGHVKPSGNSMPSTSQNITRHEGGARMSQSVIHNGTVYLAGQVAEGANVAEQTQKILAEIDRLLALSGSSKARLLSAQIFLADISTFAEMNKVWDGWVDKANAPARATVESKLAARQFLVEIMVIAAQG
jgi:enamine deaminase RidA (YjgF/YER057c/UK114 family)